MGLRDARGGRLGEWFDRASVRVLAIYGACALVALVSVPRFFMAAEDAVILWAYSRNLALHGAITYVAGGPHTEGATDFAWMLLVAGAMRCGVAPFVFTAVVNGVCLVLLGVLLVRLAGLRLTAVRVLAVMGAACLFPQILAAASGFATLPDAVLLTWLVTCVLRKRAAAASLLALLLCLFRPDGVVFAVPLLLALMARSTNRRRDVAMVGMAYLAPGAAYFGWRAWYFGELFPLPFLVKGDAHRILHTVVGGSIRTSLVFLLFAAALIVLVWRSGANRSVSRIFIANRTLVECLLGIPTLFYWCMRLDQNVGFRFFFYIPLAAAILLAVNWEDLEKQRWSPMRVGLIAWLLLVAMPLRREVRTFLDLQSPQLRDISLELERIPGHGTLLSSEAGIVPYYSGWRSIDPWGLNTAEFAHRFFQPEDVVRIAPSLIHLHPDLGESCVVQADWRTPYAERGWPHLTRNMIAGADPTVYYLWLTSYGSARYRLRRHWSYGEGDRDCWLVRRDAPEHDAVAGILRRHHGVLATRASAP